MAQKATAETKSSESVKRATRTWQSLTPELSQWILEAVNSMGFERMTPVQASTIPLFTGNKDPVVEAVTGSGKTLAFLIPIVQRLLKLEELLPKHHIGAIVISPTRELAIQIHSVLLQLLAFHSPSAASLQEPDKSNKVLPSDARQTFHHSTALSIIPQLILGGANSTPRSDLSAFLQNSPNLIIATPGRLLELLSSPYVHAPQSSFQVLVLDEADRLLDLGFKDTLSRILQRLPKQRRTGLFSASVSEAVEELVRVGIQNPYRVNVKVKSLNGAEDARTPASLHLHYMSTTPTEKLPLLLKLIVTLDPQPLRTIAYAPTCATVDYFQHVLPSLIPFFCPKTGLKIISMHGKHKQTHREKNLAHFTNALSPSLLLTTDVAARGLDIPSVDLTVQLDPPTDEKSFLHRAGRAGRAGRKGVAVVFLMPGREADEYPAFLSVRKTPVSPFTEYPISISQEEAEKAVDGIRKIVKQDRALHEKAQQAFPGYVQAYRKHRAASIFRVNELPWKDLVNAWGLLKIPRMPEIKRWGANLQLPVEIDWENYPYRDQAREKLRRTKSVHDKVEEGGVETLRISGKRKRDQDAWSKKREDQATREARRDKRERKRTREKEDNMTPNDKSRHEELQNLIEQVRRQHGVSGSQAMDEFHGFD